MTEVPDESYCPSLKGAEFFAILSRGSMAFRFGPYTGPEVGEIMQQCQLEGIPVYITANCGPDFDWDIARDFARGNPVDWRKMDEAPTDGSPIIGDVNGSETRIIWWLNWECWRELADNMRDVGQPVSPVRWRHLTDEERGNEG